MQSVADQDYGRDGLEHIIIDGGSSDGTLNLIAEYDDLDAVDFWRSEPDSGIYSAMNKGLAAASGSIINFLNSDDYFTPAAVGSSVRALNEHEADFSYAKTQMIGADNRYIRDCWLSAPEFFYFGMPGCHQSMFVKKDWFDKAGPFDESFRIFADWNFMLSIYLQNAIPAFVDEYLVKFRSDGVSDNWYENPVAQSEKSRIICEHYLDRITLDETEIRALERFLIHPLSDEYEVDEIVGIYDKYRDNDRFMSDCHKLLAFSLLNRGKFGIHGHGADQKRSQMAGGSISVKGLTHRLYEMARRPIK